MSAQRTALQQVQATIEQHRNVVHVDRPGPLNPLEALTIAALAEAASR